MRCGIICLVAGFCCATNVHAQGGWKSYHVPAGASNVSVLVFEPDQIPADGFSLLIALHGWNLKADEWKTSGIDTLASKHGILVVCPQMGVANYERKYFPETKMKWNSVPSGPWIREQLLPFVEKTFRISSLRSRRGLIGVSTGGHGALLEAGYYPESFGFAGMISGDFDVSETPSDGLAKATFGPFASFRSRWKSESAVSFMSSYKDVRVYIGHGSVDPVAPVSQARLAKKIFEEKAKESPGQFPFQYHEDAGGKHEWNFWRTEIAPAIEFFAAGFRSDR